MIKRDTDTVTVFQKIKRRYKAWFSKPILCLMVAYLLLCVLQDDDMVTVLLTIVFISVIFPPLIIFIDRVLE